MNNIIYSTFTIQEIVRKIDKLQLNVEFWLLEITTKLEMPRGQIESLGAHQFRNKIYIYILITKNMKK